MGLFDRFRRTTALDTAGVDTPDFYGAWRLSREEYLRILGMSPAEMWRTQPYLRIVVNFMARNIAQLGMQSFQRVSETDRQRLRDGSLVTALGAPNRATTSYELFYGLVADLALYDVGYWLLSDDPDQWVTRLPVPWVSPKGGDALGPERYEVRRDDSGQAVKIPADQILAFHGWHPDALTVGSSPVNALKEILAEQVEAARYRTQVWQRGGKVGAVLSRPAGAPAWSDEARKQFKADWKTKFTGEGPEVGGTPMLEDGMTLQRVDFNADEMQFTEGARLALNTIAAVYHIPPPMVGLLDNANYSNVREFRKMLYGDTLGPVLAQIEDRVNRFLVPRLDTRPGVYVEFNVGEKLQGNFEDQASALQTSVGAPWMTRDEARSRMNLPAIAGADSLIVPLNVLEGGQASPTDSGSQNAGKSLEPRFKAATPAQNAKIEQVLAAFFHRQGKAVLSRLGAGDDWWDGSRWDKELASDLTQVSHALVSILGKNEAEHLGYPADFDPDLTVNFVKAVSQRFSSTINETTRSAVASAHGDPESDPADVFKQAVDQRAGDVGSHVGAFMAGFSLVEATKQVARNQGLKATKTWATGTNPRPEHAAMDGETVAIDDDFSNGDHWAGGAPNCNCSVTVNI